MRKLTASSIGQFKTCPRAFLYAYVMGRKRIAESAPLAFGSLVHEALEQWWLNGPEVARATITASGAKDEDRYRAHAMLDNYNPTIDGIPAKERFDVAQVDGKAAIEMLFGNLPIINPDTNRAMRGYTLNGKLDGLLVDKRDGSKWILEHKTSSEDIAPGSVYWQRLAIDAQISLYCISQGCNGVMYDVLKKPSIKFCGKDKDAAAYGERCSQTIKESLGSYYQFRPVIRSAEDIEEARYDLFQQVKLLSECERKNMWPRNDKSCRSFFGNCAYLAVCSGCARIDDDTMFANKKAENEELEAA